MSKPDYESCRICGRELEGKERAIGTCDPCIVFGKRKVRKVAQPNYGRRRVR